MVLVCLRTVLKMDSQYLFGSSISDDAEAATWSGGKISEER